MSQGKRLTYEQQQAIVDVKRYMDVECHVYYENTFTPRVPPV